MDKVYSQNGKLTKAEIGLAYKHMKRWSILLVFREIEIKTMVKYPVILTKWTQIKKSDNTSVYKHVWEKERPGITGGSINWG